jgi:hypothetical protein
VAQQKIRESKPVEPGTKLRNSTTALITGDSFADVAERLADFAAEHDVPEGELASVYFNPIFGDKEIRGYTASVSFRVAHFGDEDDGFQQF